MGNVIKRITVNKLLLLIILLSALLRFYRLDSLLAGMWGDVIEGHKLVQGVLSGSYYFRFEFGGDGPVFSYYLVPFVTLLGLSFYSMKVASAFAGVLFILAVYLLGKELVNEKVGLVTALIASVPFPLTWNNCVQAWLL